MKRISQRMNVAQALLITPTIMFSLLIYFAVREPSLLVKYWDMYLLIFGLPYAAAVGLWIWVKKEPDVK